MSTVCVCVGQEIALFKIIFRKYAAPHQGGCPDTEFGLDV